MLNKITVVCLGVGDMERAIRFYKDGLGFETKESRYDPSVIFFSAAAGLKLELYPLDGLAEDISAGAPPVAGGGFGGITLACNVESKEEVCQITELARRAGAKIEKEPQDAFWGGYHSYFSDPDGHCWEIVFGPDFNFDDNGMLVM